MSRDLLAAPRTRCLAVWLAVTTALAVATLLVAPDLRHPAPTRFDEALVLVCEAALLACAAWAWLATTAVVLDAARGLRATRRGVPDGVRRVVLAACGAALVTGVVQPAHADGVGTDRRAPAALVHGIPLPERASAVGHLSRLAARHAQTQHQDAVVVRRGDTLWDLAEERLGDATAWPRLYRANRAVVGGDPDLIQPGQRLALPHREESR